jgi:hypothetical protein
MLGLRGLWWFLKTQKFSKDKTKSKIHVTSHKLLMLITYNLIVTLFGPLWQYGTSRDLQDSK